MEVNELRYPSKATIDRLTRDLNLEGADEFTQDWESAVSNVGHLSEYVNYYENAKLNVNEKTTLMRITLEAYNDYINLENKKDIFGDVIKNFLIRDFFIHRETIKYWSCDDEPLEDCFAITAFIRELGKN